MKRFLFCATFAMLLASTSCANTKKKSVVTEVQSVEQMDAKFVVKTIPASVKGSEIINTLKKTYAGKVVVVDIWATWCPPCRRAMKDIDAIKPALEKKGAIFVYLTGETSPLADWKAMIPSIEGEHYRLTNQQWKELGQSLGMVGIPAYMILNKDGSVAFSNVTSGGFPGNDLIQNETEAALAK